MAKANSGDGKRPAKKATPGGGRRVEDAPRVEVSARAALRAWFTRNCAEPAGVWIVYERPAKGTPGGLDEAAIIDEALCFGWIDSRSKRLDERRSMLYVSPRRPGGTWSARNKARVAALEAEGLMAAPGRAKVDAARADGSWGAIDAAG